MSHLDPVRNMSARELRKFGLLVGGVFLGLGAFTYWRHKPVPTFGTLLAVGGVLFVFGVVAPRVLGPVYTGWMKLALLLSKITTPIFMGVIYFLLLTPIGLVMRLFGKQPLRSSTKAGASHWVTRPAGARASSLARQF